MNFVEDLIIFYNNDLSYKKLVFAHMKVLRWAYLLFGFLSSFLILGSSYISNKIAPLLHFSKTDLSIISIMIGYILFAIMSVIFIGRSNYITKSRYRNSLENFRLKRVVKFFEDHKGYAKFRDNPSSLDDLIDIIIKIAERKKYSTFVMPGLTLAIFLPLWARFIDWFFVNIHRIDTAFICFGFFLSIIYLIIMLGSLFYEIIYNESERLKDLAKILEAIKYNLSVFGTMECKEEPQEPAIPKKHRFINYLKKLFRTLDKKGATS